MKKGILIFGLIFGVLQGSASAQLIALSDKTTYKVGEPINVGYKFVNPTPNLLTWSDNGMRLLISIAKQDTLEDTVNESIFKVSHKGLIHQANSISFSQQNQSFSGGSIGPFKSLSFGGNLGHVGLFNILHGHGFPLGPLVFSENLDINLVGGNKIDVYFDENLRILTPGVYEILVMLQDITIDNYSYSGAHYLTANTYITIE